MSTKTSSNEGKTACYLYALAPGTSRLELAEVSGVGGGPLRQSQCGDFQAVLEEVPLDEFSQETLEARLQDIRWVEEKVRAHDRVERAIAEQTTVLPFRFCTVLQESSDIEKLVDHKSAEFEAMLARVAGASEWGVKFIRKRGARPNLPSGEVTAGGGQGQGVAYLMRKKQELEGREQNRRDDRAAADTLAGELAELAREKTTIPGKRDQDRNLILNTSFLVDQTREREFRARVEALREQAAGSALALEITGPWPPYSFTT